ncbi:MAG: hypothetical protein ACLQHK_00400 [Gallionellaceae bacterium]
MSNIPSFVIYLAGVISTAFAIFCGIYFSSNKTLGIWCFFGFLVFGLLAVFLIWQNEIWQAQINKNTVARPAEIPLKPNLMLSMSGANIFIPDAPDMRNHLTGIAINAKVWNTGVSSVATEWSLSVILKDMPPIIAQLTKIPNSLHLNGPINSTIIRAKDALDDKTKRIQIQRTPVEGTLLFYVPIKKNLIMEPSTKLELKVKDIYGKESATTKVMGDWLSR